jgi:iron(III)-salmochelin esterase
LTGSLRLLSVAVAVLAVLACRRAPEQRREAAATATLLPRAPEAPLFVGVAPRPPPSPSNGAKRRELTWTFEAGPFGPTDVVISVPERAGPELRLPVLVALHGRGESLKGNVRGARGWIDDYGLEQALLRLGEPPLQSHDFQGYVSRPRLRRINGALSEHPYEGLIIVCPYLPDVLRRRAAFERAETLAAFIVDELLPRVYSETPAIGTPETTGIDGVSLGGRASLLVGAARPLAFGAVGALQAAIDGGEVTRFAELAARAVTHNPQLELRILTSQQDHFRRVNQRLSALLTKQGVRHQYLSVVGTHSYRFNRGPGALEMLLFHDRALRGMPWR